MLLCSIVLCVRMAFCSLSPLKYNKTHIDKILCPVKYIAFKCQKVSCGALSQLKFNLQNLWLALFTRIICWRSFLPHFHSYSHSSPSHCSQLLCIGPLFVESGCLVSWKCGWNWWNSRKLWHQSTRTNKYDTSPAVTELTAVHSCNTPIPVSFFFFAQIS